MLKSSVMNQAKKKKILLARIGSPPVSKKTAESLPKTRAALPYRFSVCAQYVKCGKPNCKCASGQPHGPYFAAFWKEGGRIRKRYVRLEDVEQMRDLSEQPRLLLRQIAESKGVVRKLLFFVRDNEKLIRQLSGI